MVVNNNFYGDKTMKKFQVIETSSGGEIGDPFEAKDRESALESVLEGQNYSIEEIDGGKKPMAVKKSKITIIVQGGLIQDVLIPKKLKDTIVIVRDYDTEGADPENLKEDEDGSEYVESEWGV